MLANGVYTLRVVAIDSAGLMGWDEGAVEVGGDFKPGSMSVSFVDGVRRWWRARASRARGRRACAHRAPPRRAKSAVWKQAARSVNTNGGAGTAGDLGTDAIAVYARPRV